MALLARSGGARATDTFEVFPCAEPTDEGTYHVHFFVHGLSHRSQSAIQRAERLASGEALRLMWDFQNEFDGNAFALRTVEAGPQDVFEVLGYCPRYLAVELHRLIEKVGWSSAGWSAAQVSVERVNPAPAPVQFRILCNLTMLWPKGYRPFATDEFEPIAETESATMPLSYAAV